MFFNYWLQEYTHIQMRWMLSYNPLNEGKIRAVFLRVAFFNFQGVNILTYHFFVDSICV